VFEINFLFSLDVTDVGIFSRSLNLNLLFFFENEINTEGERTSMREKENIQQ
jgi:hypothetical protein